MPGSSIQANVSGCQGAAPYDAGAEHARALSNSRANVPPLVEKRLCPCKQSSVPSIEGRLSGFSSPFVLRCGHDPVPLCPAEPAKPGGRTRGRGGELFPPHCLFCLSGCQGAAPYDAGAEHARTLSNSRANVPPLVEKRLCPCKQSSVPSIEGRPSGFSFPFALRCGHDPVPLGPAEPAKPGGRNKGARGDLFPPHCLFCLKACLGRRPRGRRESGTFRPWRGRVRRSFRRCRPRWAGVRT